MKTIRGYKTELAPNNKQVSLFWRCAGISRFVFNWGLATWKQQYEDGGKPSQYSLRRLFNSIKAEQCSFVMEVPYAVTEAAFYNLDAAFQHFFRRVKNGEEKPGYPKFKSRKHPKQSFQLRGIKVEHDRIRFSARPSIWVRLKERGYLPTSDSGVRFCTYATISHRAGRWYISVQAEDEMGEPPGTAIGVVGVDLGLKSRAVLSDGTVFDTPKVLYEYERKLARLQREQSRRKKDGANWNKTKRKVQRLHAKVANTRKHWLHNISRHIIDLQPSAIVLEDLNASGMVQNRHLAKAVSDAGFYELRRQIEYKAAWAGVEVIIADRWYPSSKTCSGCGWHNADLTLADRTFVCPECGLEIDRDLNAARNLAGLAA